MPSGIDDANLDLMFANTYHLLLQPGHEHLQKAGGIHKFIGRNRPTISDSGRFQMFSLGLDADELDENKSPNKNNNGNNNNSGANRRHRDEGVEESRENEAYNRIYWKNR